MKDGNDRWSRATANLITTHKKQIATDAYIHRLQPFPRRPTHLEGFTPCEAHA